jgi:hypothetical protein
MFKLWISIIYVYYTINPDYSIIVKVMKSPFFSPSSIINGVTHTIKRRQCPIIWYRNGLCWTIEPLNGFQPNNPMKYHYLLTGVPSMGWYKIGGWNRNEHYRISLWPIGSWPSAIGGVQWIDLFLGEFITGNMKAGWWLTYPSEKYESQLGWLSHILWKIKNVPNHQPER